MPAYTSRQFTNSPNAGVGAYPGNMVGFVFEVAVTSALTASDTFTFGKVPKGFRVLGATLEATDMEAGTGVTISVGDSGSGTRLFNAATVARDGSAASAGTTVSALHHLYTDDTIITGATGGTVTTGATGTIWLSIWGIVQGTPS
jgi:hypothetical protein